MLKRLLRVLFPRRAERAQNGARAAEPEAPRRAHPAPAGNGDAQALDVYWDPNFAAVLDTWGEGTAWSEIQELLANRKGRVLDIACGTGKVITILARFPDLEGHGCDISDLLLAKAAEKGIPKDRLRICDATTTGCPDAAFEHSYSIGSLEHFSNDGIDAFLRECRRITSGSAFHMIPLSRSGRDEGWIRDGAQEYFNNGEAWWLARFRAVFPRVLVLESRWSSETSVGRWFVCDPDRQSA